MFTTRYALNPYIKQKSLFFKGLNFLYSFYSQNLDILRNVLKRNNLPPNLHSHHIIILYIQFCYDEEIAFLWDLVSYKIT